MAAGGDLEKTPVAQTLIVQTLGHQQFIVGVGVEKSTHAICGFAAGIGAEQPATTLAVSNSINLRMMNVP
jgi:hypothetical protein